MIQPVEQPPVAVAPEMESSQAAGAITNTVNMTGTTPTTTTKDPGNAKLPDTKPTSNVDDSLSSSITTVNNSFASTAVANILIAEALNELRSGMRELTRQLVPDSKSALTNDQ